MRYTLDGLCFIGLLLFACCVSSSFTEKSNPKIIIIGAGASGIASAVRLLEYGFKDITILEAEPRIGGRIYTIPYGKSAIDMGAKLCLGENGNIVYELANKKDLLEHSREGPDTYSYVRSKVELLTQDVVQRLSNITNELYDEKDAMQYKGSLGSYMKKKFDELMALPENAEIDKEIAQEFFEMYTKEVCANEAVDNLDVLSAPDYRVFNEIEGDYEMYWKDKGFIEFLRLLMKSDETKKEYGILDGHIKLNKKVNHINWQRNDHKTLVKCEDGEEFLADHVIVTVSLGVLKANHEHMFQPALPKEKQNAINTLQYGTFGKIFLEFSENFWSKLWDGVVFLWRKEDLAEIRSSSRSWLEDLYSFNTVPYQPNVLEGWIIGESSRHMETLPLKEIEEGCMYILNRFIPPDVPQPINVTISTWYSNPNFRGCYSYHSGETENTDESNQHLANAIINSDDDMCKKPALQFAGEATHSRYYGTVHGAVESGFREAQRIHEFYA